MQRASSFSLSPQAVNSAAHDDHLLFEAPSDLLCPITQDVLRDPVLTAGQPMHFRCTE